MGAAAPFAPMIFTAAMGVSQYKQQGAIGKFNESVANRNAEVLEVQKEQIEQKAEFDIAQFRKDFYRMTGTSVVALSKSGVQVGTGSAANIALSNAYEAKLQEDLIKYNSKVATNNKQEEANFARIKGSMAREQARLAQIGTIASTGTSLLSMGNFGGGQSYSKNYTGFGQSGYGRYPGDIM